MKKSLFCLSLFSLLLCGCNNVELKKDAFKNEKADAEKKIEDPIVEGKEDKVEVDKNYVEPLGKNDTFCFFVENEELSKISKTFVHKERNIISDVSTFNDFNNTFSTLLNVSNESNNEEYELPEVDFEKQDLAVATFKLENRKAYFSSKPLSMAGVFSVSIYEVLKEEGAITSFGVFFAVIRKNIVEDLALNYNENWNVDYYTAG